MRSELTLNEFFGPHSDSRELFDAVTAAAEAIGPFELRVTKSQIAFRHGRGFAYVWRPEQYLHRPGAPLVLTIGLLRRDESPRWKQVVEPAPGRFTHHLELRAPDDVDEEVVAWLREAWEAANGQMDH